MTLRKLAELAKVISHPIENDRTIEQLLFSGDSSMPGSVFTRP
jgi:hypothetical protein